MTSARSRLAVLLTIGLAAVPLGVSAQPGAKVARLGILSGGAPPPPGQQSRYARALGDLGWVEGQNLSIVRRDAHGQVERLPALAAELVGERVDAILAATNQEIAAARRVTTTVPIVMVFGAAPVELGFIKSLARPGTNVTGAVVHSPETSGKMVEILRDAVPGARRIALLQNPDFVGMTAYSQAAEEAARRLGLTLQPVEVRTLAQLPQSLDRVRASKPHGWLVAVDWVVFEGRQAILEFAARERLPALYTVRDFVDAGGLMSYAASPSDQINRAARCVDRIFRGARPAELPVEQPTQYDLVINLKTAGALGLAIPPAVRARASEAVGP